jgi:hypothetical protein
MLSTIVTAIMNASCLPSMMLFVSLNFIWCRIIASENEFHLVWTNLFDMRSERIVVIDCWITTCSLHGINLDVWLIRYRRSYTSCSIRSLCVDHHVNYNVRRVSSFNALVTEKKKPRQDEKKRNREYSFCFLLFSFFSIDKLWRMHSCCRHRIQRKVQTNR